MSLDNPQCYASFTGNGATTVFDADFPISEKSHIAVSGVKQDGTPFTFSQGVDYQAVLVFDAEGEPVSASITLVQPLPSGWTMYVARVVPIVQPVQFHNQGGMSPEVVEDEFDYLTMIAQQIDFKTFSGNAQMQHIAGQYDALRAKDAQLDGRITQLDSSKADKTAVAMDLAKKADKSELSQNVAELQGQITALDAAKAGKTELTGAFSNLQTQVSNLASVKADKTAMTAELAKKADKTELAGQASQLQGQISVLATSKADKTAVATDLAKKADKSELSQNVAELQGQITALDAAKAGKTELTGAFSNLQTQVSNLASVKADKTAMTAELAKKADKTELAGQASQLQGQISALDAAKADKTALVDAAADLQSQVNNIKSTKADKTEMTAELGKKSDKTEVAAQVGNLQTQITSLKNVKADKTAVAAVDDLLQDQIHALEARMPEAVALAQEIVDRKAADAVLQGKIDGLDSVKAEKSVLQETAARLDAADQEMRGDIARIDIEKVDVDRFAGAVLALNMADEEMRHGISQLSADKAERTHAATHAAGGDDPLTPGDIGALERSHLDAPNPHPQYLLKDVYREQGEYGLAYDRAINGMRLVAPLFFFDSPFFIRNADAVKVTSPAAADGVDAYFLLSGSSLRLRNVVVTSGVSELFMMPLRGTIQLRA